ncbi:MAG: hypothetical protein AB8B55_12335 [Mariniblastus sp.]
MSSLSFSCPKCDKVHEGIKQKMAGHKVRCQCGFVFRLGPKRAKQPGAADDIIRKQKLKAATKISDEVIDAIAIHSDEDISDPNAIEPLDAIPVANDSQEEIFDGIPVSDSPSPARPVAPARDKQAPQKQARHKQARHKPAARNQAPSQPRQSAPAQQPYPGQFPSQAVNQARPGQQAPPAYAAPQPPHQHQAYSPPYQNQPYQNQPYQRQPHPSPGYPQQGYPHQAYPTNPLVDVPEFADVQIPQTADNPHLQSRSPLPGTPVQKKRRMRRRNEKHLKSNIGPIWTLILSVIGIPVMIFVVLKFGEALLLQYRLLGIGDPTGVLPGGGFLSVGSNLTVSFILTIIMTIAVVGTTISMIISGVVAIIELTRGVHLGWASKIAAIFATVTVVGLFLMFAVNVFTLFQAVEAMSELSEQLGRKFDTSKLGYAIGRMAGYSFSMAIIPIIVAVTGFARNVKN